MTCGVGCQSSEILAIQFFNVFQYDTCRAVPQLHMWHDPNAVCQEAARLMLDSAVAVAVTDPPSVLTVSEADVEPDASCPLALSCVEPPPEALNVMTDWPEHVTVTDVLARFGATG